MADGEDKLFEPGLPSATQLPATISRFSSSHAYIIGMSAPRDRPPLGEFELLVLLAILQAGEDAYGSTILQELQRRADRAIARGALYVTLDRLASKGYVSSRTGDPAPARGGGPRRYYLVKPVGLAQLRRALEDLGRMHEGLALGLKHPWRA
jgi:DNA-binding PadR family transcriptional regulator